MWHWPFPQLLHRYYLTWPAQRLERQRGRHRNSMHRDKTRDGQNQSKRIISDYNSAASPSCAFLTTCTSKNTVHTYISFMPKILSVVCLLLSPLLFFFPPFLSSPLASSSSTLLPLSSPLCTLLSALSSPFLPSPFPIISSLLFAFPSNKTLTV